MSNHKGKHVIKNIEIINAPIEKVWEAIHNSNEMVVWAPPVNGVEISLVDGQKTEQLGSVRKVLVDFGKKQDGYFIEKRTVHIEQKSVGYEIFEETIGLFKVAKFPSFQINLFKVGNNQTRIEFNIFMSPKGFMGHLMKGMINKQFKKSNLEGIASLKSYLETGVPIK